jgi:DNA-binding CsgD family transcriptional regulator
MKLDRYYEVSRSRDRAALRSRLEALAAEMDFGIAGAQLVLDGPNETSYHYVGNRPENFAAATDRSIVKIDPVMSHLRTSTLPLFYDQDYYVNAGAPELWELAAPFGYRTGIAIALRVTEQKLFILGLDRDKPIPRDQRSMERLFGDLALLAFHCLESTCAIVDREGSPRTIKLSRREVEILRLARDGLTVTQIADRVCLSDAGVKYHLSNSAVKLQARGRTHTIARAISLGLLPQ